MARILRQAAERLLANVPEEYVFRCCDGRTLRNMQELSDAFSGMTDETFAYHANTDKNDFSNWTRDVIQDEKLARDLERSTNRTRAAKNMADRVSFLKGKLA